ncbi:hypothetical protein PEBR_15826 [Penicillium brasilianum]|uniref:Arrestin-like N-terminal domain-containing protein n=1 Tax=Penicillium brasilianum TaxID=104259 RepID=A0A1S9RPZ4_PENBI|nr:hypothetical protein PEBR_15826 [Penicillium brasilianum]
MSTQISRPPKLNISEVMARVLACNGSDLSIHLDSAESFLPGQRITGYVSRISPWVSTETRVMINLHGRCSTEFFNRDSSCCSSLALFGQDGFQSELFDGALHIQRSCPDKKSWPFEIDIPEHPDQSCLRFHPFGKASYLPLSSANLHALPPSFDLTNSTAGSSRDSAVVEYYLEATITTSDASKFAVARLPVRLRCESSPFPITDFDVKLHSRQYYTVTSPRLAPVGDTARISKRQQIAKVLGVSGNPHLTFCLEISVASVLQKDSPYPIPFEIRAIPQWADTSKCIANVAQDIGITSFALAIHSTSSSIAFANGMMGGGAVVRENHFKMKTILSEYSKSKRTKQRNDGVQCEAQFGANPSDKHASSFGSRLWLPVDDNSSALDLGRLLNLNLQQDQFKLHEAPTFVTYNVKRTYDLDWKMALEVGEKILTVKGRHPVLILEKTD